MECLQWCVRLYDRNLEGGTERDDEGSGVFRLWVGANSTCFNQSRCQTSSLRAVGTEGS